MTTITDFKCVLIEELRTDAYGNNAAFACPDCGYSVLIVTHDENQRGMHKGNPAICRGCNRKFWQTEILEDKQQIILESEK